MVLEGTGKFKDLSELHVLVPPCPGWSVHDWLPRMAPDCSLRLEEPRLRESGLRRQDGVLELDWSGHAEAAGKGAF